MFLNRHMFRGAAAFFNSAPPKTSLMDEYIDSYVFVIESRGLFAVWVHKGGFQKWILVERA